MMGNRVVRQPNGKLAIFSTVIDKFTHTNCTHEDVVVALLGEVLAAQLPAIERAVKLAEEDNDLDRWRGALQTISTIHGDDEAAKAQMATWTVGETLFKPTAP
jgi:hypothetical protein